MIFRNCSGVLEKGLPSQGVSAELRGSRIYWARYTIDKSFFQVMGSRKNHDPIELAEKVISSELMIENAEGSHFTILWKSDDFLLSQLPESF